MTEDLWLTFTESIEILTFNTLKGENLPDLPTPGPPRMQILDSTDFPLQFDDIAVSLKSIPNSLFYSYLTFSLSILLSAKIKFFFSFFKTIITFPLSIFYS